MKIHISWEHPKIRGVTYGITEIMRWDSLDNDRSETNYGRQKSVSIDLAKTFAKRLDKNGIDFANNPPVYYDAITKERLDGEMRYLASKEMSVPQETWNMCPVTFKNEQARIEFCVKINNREKALDRDNSILDIETAVRTIWTTRTLDGIETTEEWLRKETKYLSEGSGDITQKMIEGLIATFVTELHADQGLIKSKGGDRFLSWNRSVFNRLNALYKLGMKKGKTLDPWYKNVFKNRDKIVVCVEQYTFNSVVYKLIKSIKDASHASGDYSLQKPVNLAFSIEIPTQKGVTLNDVRVKMFSKYLRDLENQLLSMQPLMVIGREHISMDRKHFPWNHPDAEHVFIPQDKVNETDSYSLIRIKNREFN